MNENEKQKRKEARWNLRASVIDAYGGKCICCGEDTYEFMAIHHRYGGGNAERKTGLIDRKLYNKIIEENFPDKYTILCHNCNLADGLAGYCPHKGRPNPIPKQSRYSDWRDDMRNQCIIHYGKKCTCCGETTLEFLAINHINRDGSVHRKEIKRMSIYKWLIDNNFPKIVNVLCHNCNLADGFYKHCPHNSGVIKRIANIPDALIENRFVQKLKASHSEKFPKYIETIEKKFSDRPEVLKASIRFFDSIEIFGDCWLWTGKTEKDGSIRFFFTGRMLSARRFALFLLSDDVLPDNVIVTATCGNLCVNTSHLNVIVQNQNMDFKPSTSLPDNAPRRRSCARGHEFTEESTRIYNGRHICKRCTLELNYRNDKDESNKSDNFFA